MQLCACMLSRFNRVWLFETLWTVAHQGFSRQEYWSGLPCPPPGDLPDPGTEPPSLLHWQAGSLPLAPPGKPLCSFQFSSVQSLSRVWLFATPWIAARQASLSITNSWSSLKLTSIESVMPSSHLILCFLLPPIPPSIRVFSNESTLRLRWPKYWSFSCSISPSNEHPGLISFRMDWLDRLADQGTLKSLLQHHSSKASILRHSAFFTVQLSHPYSYGVGHIPRFAGWMGKLDSQEELMVYFQF